LKKLLTLRHLFTFNAAIKAALEEFASVLNDGEQKQQLVSYLDII
jgi:hypothetical protein